MTRSSYLLGTAFKPSTPGEEKAYEVGYWNGESSASADKDVRMEALSERVRELERALKEIQQTHTMTNVWLIAGNVLKDQAS